MPEFDIKEVSSWRDIPAPGASSGLKGYQDPKTGIIYTIKGVTTTAELEHEKYHRIRRHPNKPRSSSRFVSNEIEAYLYAYERLKRPRHLLMKLRAIFYDLVWDVYSLKPSSALNIIREELSGDDIPPGWKKDYSKLVAEVRKVTSK